jgi:lipopolysaccharide/colanic/teichoic acid biosynthesis glycosyltransferase
MTTIPISLEQSTGSERRDGQHAALLSVALLRRVLNIAIALIALVLTLPLMLLVMLAVRLSSRGPVFYTQTRIGLNRRQLLPGNARCPQADCGGKPFTIYKFRTMRVNGHGPKQSGQVWATPDDPRITRVGRILRLYRLDELPQLVNVLLGDMDIVGPRPEQPAIFAQLREQIPGYEDRQRVRPGITGWAQINQHYDTSIEDVRKKLAFDLEYISRRSIWEDLRIMLRTLPVVTGKMGGW